MRRRLPPHGDHGQDLRIRHRAHEAFVLMILMMTVELRRSRIVGDEIDLDRTEPRQLIVFFITPSVALSPILVTSKGVTMQVDGMVVAASVGHHAAIALPSLGREYVDRW